MTILRNFVTAAPRDAVSDLIGMAAIGVMIFAGFTVPALF